MKTKFPLLFQDTIPLPCCSKSPETASLRPLRNTRDQGKRCNRSFGLLLLFFFKTGNHVLDQICQPSCF